MAQGTDLDELSDLPRRAVLRRQAACHRAVRKAEARPHPVLAVGADEVPRQLAVSARLRHLRLPVLHVGGALLSVAAAAVNADAADAVVALKQMVPLPFFRILRVGVGDDIVLRPRLFQVELNAGERGRLLLGAGQFSARHQLLELKRQTTDDDTDIRRTFFFGWKCLETDEECAGVVGGGFSIRLTVQCKVINAR